MKKINDFNALIPDLGKEYNKEKQMNLSEAIAVNDFIIWLKKNYVISKPYKQNLLN